MLFSGNTQTLDLRENVLELKFDSQSSKVNVFNKEALTELGDVVTLLEQHKDAAGLIVGSAKSGFIVGADITEFLDYFSAPDKELGDMLTRVKRWNGCVPVLSSVHRQL